MKETKKNLTSGRLLARNTLWNVVGQLVPMAVAVIAIPPLVRGLGVARFGLLSLAWVVIGYFSMFDLGIGRALTKLIADKIAANDEHSIAALAATGLLLLLLVGICGGLVTFAISPWLVQRALKLPQALQIETLHGFQVLAISIPMVTITSGWRGILEAHQSFRIVNLIRIPMSIFSFAGPLLVLPFSHSLVAVISLLAGGRLIGCLAHQFACFHAVPALRHGFVLQRASIPPLLKTGFWMTVSNLVGPLVLYSDRFLIGVLLSVTAVTYYTAPFDMISRLLVIPVAISGVLFPAFAFSFAQDPSRTDLLLARGMKYTFLVMFPLILAIVALAPEILGLWLGATFAEKSGTVLRWLAAGIFMNCLTNIPFALLQAIGRADVTGKVLMIDLPMSLLGASVLIAHLGIEGAAIAWFVRAALEAIIFLVLSQHFLSKTLLPLTSCGISIAISVLAFYVATLPATLTAKSAFLACSLLAFAFVGWFFLLRPEERSFLTRGRLGLVEVSGSKLVISGTKGDAV